MCTKDYLCRSKNQRMVGSFLWNYPPLSTQSPYRFEADLYRIIRSGNDGIVIPPIYLKPAHKKYSADPDLERIARFGVHVRHILLQNRHSEEIIDILNLCPNVENLALWIVHGESDHKLMPAFEGLQRL